MKPKVLVLFVRYGTSQYIDALERLQEHLVQIHVRPEKLIVIDNQVAPGTFLPGVEPGDNRFYEFSGWNSAIQKYSDLVRAVDVVLFVTSAFQESFSAYLHEFNPKILEVVSVRNVCVGHLDAYPAPIQIFGETSQAWMRTSFFALPSKLALEMGILTAEKSVDFFSEDFKNPFKSSAKLSENYKTYILDWLTGPGLGHGEWHSRFDLTEKTFSRFKQKAVAIFNEHFLSIEARKRGFPTLDPCWLNRQLCQQRMSEIPLHVNPLEQIEIRNRIYFGDLQPRFWMRWKRKILRLFC